MDYGFLEIIGPSTAITENDRLVRKKLGEGKGNPQLRIADNVLQLLRKTNYNPDYMSTAIGYLFEDMIYRFWKELLDKSFQIKRVYWDEPCTEIDSIVVCEATKKVYWGSCKLNCSQQDPENQMAHVVSFFNNRGWKSHDWYSYEHIFLFISPSFKPHERSYVEGSLQKLNDILHGNQDDLLHQCATKLSNVHERGKPFEWKAKNRPNSEEFFFISKCVSCDIKNLLDPTWIAKIFADKTIGNNNNT